MNPDAYDLIDVVSYEPTIRIESANPALIDVVIKDVVVELEPARSLLTLVRIISNSEIKLPRGDRFPAQLVFVTDLPTRRGPIRGKLLSACHLIPFLKVLPRPGLVFLLAIFVRRHCFVGKFV